jgi:hypothetical protein
MFSSVIFPAIIGALALNLCEWSTRPLLTFHASANRLYGRRLIPALRPDDYSETPLVMTNGAATDPNADSSVRSNASPIFIRQAPGGQPQLPPSTTPALPTAERAVLLFFASRRRTPNSSYAFSVPSITKQASLPGMCRPSVPSWPKYGASVQIPVSR